jgi:hypothetical protein
MHRAGSRAAMAGLCLWNLVTLGPQVLLLEHSIRYAPHLRHVSKPSQADMLPAACHALTGCAAASCMPLR